MAIPDQVPAPQKLTQAFLIVPQKEGGVLSPSTRNWGWIGRGGGGRGGYIGIVARAAETVSSAGGVKV